MGNRAEGPHATASSAHLHVLLQPFGQLPLRAWLREAAVRKDDGAPVEAVADDAPQRLVHSAHRLLRVPLLAGQAAAEAGRPLAVLFVQDLWQGDGEP